MIHVNMNKNEDHEILQKKPMANGTKCEMANCKSNLDPNIKKSYFRFPQHDYFCSQWTFACARPDLVDLYLKRGALFLYKTRKVCEEHFITDDFRNPSRLSQGLFKGVVPTRNLPELKTVISISCGQKSKLIDIDEVKPIPVTSSQLKRSLKTRNCKPHRVNTLKNVRSIDKRFILKNKKLIVLKNQLRRRIKPKKLYRVNSSNINVDSSTEIRASQ